MATGSANDVEVPAVRIELLSHAGCPNVAAARDVLSECLGSIGLDVAVIERVGAYPSPSILINGVDVMRGGVLAEGRSCRLDVPTREVVAVALRRARAAENDEV